MISEMLPPSAVLKELLLGMLESAASASAEVAATQQMGINLSSAVKRDGGVVIVQQQSVEVFTRMVPKITEAIRLCDRLYDVSTPPPCLPPVVEAVPEMAGDAVEACCEHFYEKKTGWQEMQEVMRARYLAYVLARSTTKTAAASRLGIGVTYLCKLDSKEKENEK